MDNSDVEMLSDVERDNESEEEIEPSSEEEFESTSEEESEPASDGEMVQDGMVEIEIGGENEVNQNDTAKPPFNFNPWLNGMRERLTTRWRPVDYIMTFLAKEVSSYATFTSIVKNFKILGTSFASKAFPGCKETLWRRFEENKDYLSTRYWCTECEFQFDPAEGKPTGPCQCPGDSPRPSLAQFTHVSLRAQLTELLKRPNMYATLNYKYTRVKWNPNNYEDKLDGSEYKRLEREDILADPNNKSLEMWWDPVNPVKSSQATVTPALFTINEMSPNARKRYILMGGIYAGPKKMYTQDMLIDLMDELESLYTEGIKWSPHEGGPEITTRFITCTLVCDSEARWEILNFHRHNGYVVT